jgi:acyl-coenzyme A thioesterase PaaI-like protein
MKKTLLLRLINFWPPYLGSGVKVIHISPDVRSIEVRMDLKFWNRNYVGVHFGGSLYAMTDPFFMLMMMENLGSDYIVWDKAATIRFKKPGKGRVYAKFSLAQEDIDSVKAAADNGPKAEPIFSVNVLDGAGDVVAEVEKTLYVRRKDRPRHAL